MWLSCHTQEEIAEAIGYSRQAVDKFLSSSFATNAQEPACDKSVESAEDESNGLGRIAITNEEIATSKHDVAFNAPLYNVWKWKEKTAGAEHFGNSEPTLVGAPRDLMPADSVGAGSVVATRNGNDFRCVFRRRSPKLSVRTCELAIRAA